MDKFKLTTPILFLVFNRPGPTKKVFEEIKRARPSKIYIAADGPREGKPGEKEKCEEVIKIVSDIDWSCEVKTLFRKKNLGCGKAVSSAIDWFFEEVDKGIILEDDCLPNQSFFRFCQELLKKYQDDERITQISGSNFMGETNIGESYLFSEKFNVWGWATWRRAWKFYDYGLSNFKELRKKNRLKSFRENPLQSHIGRKRFSMLEEGKLDTWDYQWAFSCGLQNGLCIIPKKNLIKNLGFQEGTHTKQRKEFQLERKDIEFPLNHSKFIFTDMVYDKNFGNFFLGSKPKQIIRKILGLA
ncbi:MAG: hypothetical protein ABIJ14_00845 [Nanoarchaeota archaeon]|nr:hypothetical protein [Nanoarchaeota archaeon]